MNVIVCGGRAYWDRAKVDDVLDTLNWRCPIKAILQGGATGADELARDWAEARNIKVCTYPAVKKPDGRISWSKSNQRMIDQGKPDLVVAFLGATRTADMVRRARIAGVTLLMIDRIGDDPLLALGSRWSA